MPTRSIRTFKDVQTRRLISKVSASLLNFMSSLTEIGRYGAKTSALNEVVCDHL